MNWKILITRIIDKGYTETEIAKHVGCSQPTINRLKLGKIDDPRYTTGASIVLMAEEEYVELP